MPAMVACQAQLISLDLYASLHDPLGLRYVDRYQRRSRFDGILGELDRALVLR
jgi:hypothetical protein